VRIAILADVHANLPALRAVLADIDGVGVDATWCAGDVVGRGPHPDEVVDELIRRQIPTVQGNWDEAIGMDREQSGTLWADHEAETAGLISLAWTANQMHEEQPTTLRFSIDGRSVLLFHGSPQRASDYLWSERPTRVFARVAGDEGDDVFCFGHTHQWFHRVLGPIHFVSAGSVGCGDATDSAARYAVLTLADGLVRVEFRAVTYDHRPVVADQRAAELSLDLLAVPPAPHVLAEAG